MKILVLGGAGYVGSAVVRDLLHHGHDVTVFDLMLFGAESMMPWLNRPDFRLVKGDVRDAAQVDAATAGHDAVIVLASIVGEPACNRDPDNTAATNVGGVENALAAANEARRLTLHLRQHLQQLRRCRHRHPRQPRPANSTPSVSTPRPRSGPKSSPSPPRATRSSPPSSACPPPSACRHACASTCSSATSPSPHTASGKIVIFGQQFWRPFAHINDIAKAMRLTLEASPELVKGEIFNVGGDHNNTQKQALGEAVQKQMPHVKLEFVERNEDPRSYRVAFDKITNKLGFTPDWSIDDGIREVRECLSNGVWPDPSADRYKN